MAEEGVGALDLAVFEQLADVSGADDAAVERDGGNDVAAEPVLGAVSGELSAVPSPRQPKLKSCPTTNAAASISSTSVWMNVCHGICMTVRSKWIKTTLSMPNRRRMSSSRPWALLMSGTSVPRTSVSGCTSKLITVGMAPISSARATVRRMSAA